MSICRFQVAPKNDARAVKGLLHRDGGLCLWTMMVRVAEGRRNLNCTLQYLLRKPKGSMYCPYTACLRTLLPNSIPGIVFGTRVLNWAVFGPLGIWFWGLIAPTFKGSGPFRKKSFYLEDGFCPELGLPNVIPLHVALWYIHGPQSYNTVTHFRLMYMPYTLIYIYIHIHTHMHICIYKYKNV